LLRPLDRQSLDRVRRRAALIVTPPRIALGIFVGQHRALRLQHRPRDDILGCDQLDLVLLPVELSRDRLGNGAVGGAQPLGGEAFVLDAGKVVGCRIVARAHAGSWTKEGLESLSTRRWCRPPPKGVFKNCSTQSRAASIPISRAPSASTFASLCSRASRADSPSETNAHRQAGLRLTAIEIPIPDPHKAIPRAASPASIAAAIR